MSLMVTLLDSTDSSPGALAHKEEWSLESFWALCKVSRQLNGKQLVSEQGDWLPVSRFVWSPMVPRS